MTTPFIQKLSAFFCVLILTSYVSVAAEKDKLERLMELYATSDNFNGTVLVARKGTIILSKGYGYQDVSKKIRNSERTIFQIGSITMQMTAELILLLDSQGKLSLDDKVSRFLPDFPNADKITLKQLLTHTSGLYDYMNDTTLMNEPGKQLKQEDLFALFKDKPLAFTPGERFQFTNSNYAVLALFIEKMTRWNYNDQLKYKVLNTCGMYHSGFDFVNLTDPDKATGYKSIEKETGVEAFNVDSSLTYGGFDLYSTVTDLYKWHRSLLNHVMLPKDWQEIAYSPNKSHYALGWEVESMFQRKFVSHSATIGGFSACIMRQENDDVVVVLLQNKGKQTEVNKVIATNIVKCLYDKDYKVPVSDNMLVDREQLAQRARVWEKEPDREERVVASKKDKERDREKERTAEDKPDVAAPFIGDYVFSTDFLINITKRGNELYGQINGQESYHLSADSKPLFYKAGLDTKIEFVKDENGAINKIILHQHGRDEQGIKKEK